MAQFEKRPNLTAALLFLILVLVFMNRALFPADGYLLGGYDMRGYYYLMPQVVKEALQNGRLPLWDPYRYNGFPLFADPQTNLFYPIAWLMLILPVNLGISWYMVFSHLAGRVGHVFICSPDAAAANQQHPLPLPSLPHPSPSGRYFICF